MAPQNKILNHPDKEDIIKWLKVEGVSVREVANRLAQKYPRKNQSHLRVSYSTIQTFKSNYLNVHGQVLRDIKDATKLTRHWARKQEGQEQVAGTKTYKEVISQIAEQELDTRKRILSVFAIIESRLEVLFDKASSADFIDKDVEKFLIEYLKQLQGVIDQHKKYEEGYREQVDINVNVSVMTEQIQILRETVREILAELDPTMTLTFMSKLNEKMRQLTYGNSAESEKHTYLLDGVLSGNGTIEEVEFE